MLERVPAGVEGQWGTKDEFEDPREDVWWRGGLICRCRCRRSSFSSSRCSASGHELLRPWAAAAGIGKSEMAQTDGGRTNSWDQVHEARALQRGPTPTHDAWHYLVLDDEGKDRTCMYVSRSSVCYGPASVLTSNSISTNNTA
jgi:hypothetical protein